MPNAPEPSEPPSPWLAFFRRVRVLAAKLDAMDEARTIAERRDSART